MAMLASTSSVFGWMITRNSSLRVAPFNIVIVSIGDERRVHRAGIRVCQLEGARVGRRLTGFTGLPSPGSQVADRMSAGSESVLVDGDALEHQRPAAVDLVRLRRHAEPRHRDRRDDAGVAESCTGWSTAARYSPTYRQLSTVLAYRRYRGRRRTRRRARRHRCCAGRR